MKFRTEIDIPHSAIEIDWNKRIQLYGSCFVESIGKRLSEVKLQTDCNPFGVLYNPLSIKRAIDWLRSDKTIDECDIVERDGMYHCLLHHSSFSSESKIELTEQIEERAAWSRVLLKQADWLIITFGSSYVYRYKESGRVVSNCHKLPDCCFERYRLTVGEIVDEWSVFIQSLTQENLKLNILFTVSPIRHWKDGAHNNQLSKSTLLLAVDELCSLYSNCHYFPSYELMMDELRDYRFYEADMNHPSTQAIDYIWNCFLETYFSKADRNMIEEWNKILKSVTHRPLNAKGNTYATFNTQTLLKLTAFQEKYPFFDIRNEVSRIEERLK